MEQKVVNSTFYHDNLGIEQIGGPEEWDANEGGRPNWILTKELSYYLGPYAKKALNIPDHEGIKIIMWPGFISDGGSFSKFVAPLINATGTGRYFRAFILHDAIARTEHFTFQESNIILDEALELLGMGWVNRQKVYYSLQVGGYPTKEPALLANAKDFVQFENFEHIVLG